MCERLCDAPLSVPFNRDFLADAFQMYRDGVKHYKAAVFWHETQMNNTLHEPWMHSGSMALSAIAEYWTPFDNLLSSCTVRNFPHDQINSSYVMGAMVKLFDLQGFVLAMNVTDDQLRANIATEPFLAEDGQGYAKDVFCGVEYLAAGGDSANMRAVETVEQYDECIAEGFERCAQVTRTVSEAGLCRYTNFSMWTSSPMYPRWGQLQV